MLPGVPREMRNLLSHEVRPRLEARAGGSVLRSRTLRVTNIPESTLGELVGDLQERVAPLTLAYLPGLEGVDLRLTAWGLPAEDADERLTQGLALLRERVAELRLRGGRGGPGGCGLDLIRHAWRPARRGGVVHRWPARRPDHRGAGQLRRLPRRVIAYENGVKVRDLGVPEPLVEAHGAVSREVAEAMVRGVASRFEADFAISVTGIAGPTGATPDKPVGLVWSATLVDQAVTLSQSTDSRVARGDPGPGLSVGPVQPLPAQLVS